MLIYCLGNGGKEAVTIGAIMWLPMGRRVSDYKEDPEALLAHCRPHDEAKRPRFNMYIDQMKKHGPVQYVAETDLPTYCVKRKGFWENNGWK